MKGTVLAIGGMPDHVHLAVQLPGTIAPSALMQRVKGISSTFARNELMPGELFRWQEGYAGFSISGRHMENTLVYIRNQKQHHANGTTLLEWEAPEDLEDSPEA